MKIMKNRLWKKSLLRHASKQDVKSWIISGFSLYNVYVEVIFTLIYKQRDFLLVAKIRFDKSLIFQLV